MPGTENPFPEPAIKMAGKPTPASAVGAASAGTAPRAERRLLGDNPGQTAILALIVMILPVMMTTTNNRISDTNHRIDRVEDKITALDNKLDEEIDGLEVKMEAGFAAVDERFNKVDERFAKVDERFVQIDERFNARFDELDDKFNVLDNKFNVLDDKFDVLDKNMTALIAVLGVTDQVAAALNQRLPTSSTSAKDNETNHQADPAASASIDNEEALEQQLNQQDVDDTKLAETHYTSAGNDEALSDSDDSRQSAMKTTSSQLQQGLPRYTCGSHSDILSCLGAVAQSGRAPALQAGGRRFKSDQLHPRPMLTIRQIWEWE